MKHLMYTPFTGLGLYGGYRGKRWLRNRIHIFKQFVVPSLQSQTKKDFTLWISWRFEDRQNELVRELAEWLGINTNLKFIFTYSGVCFWDDKYAPDLARKRLAEAIHGAVPALTEEIGQEEDVLVTIQPSDDCYSSDTVERIQSLFEKYEWAQAVAYKRGYVMDYTSHRIAEWNPTTNPPFYTIKFKRKTFLDPHSHVEYAGIESHEYLPTKLQTLEMPERGFLVGTHGENISTIFEHPFKGTEVFSTVLKEFGLGSVPVLKLPISLRKKFLRRLPHGWQRKLRYIFGERFAAKIYEILRS